MERLTEDKLFKYNHDTLFAVRKTYNLDKPGQMEQAVDSLEAWVQKQEHFLKKDFSRDYLERVIIQLKGSVERAKSQLDKICTLRTVLPKFFEMCNPREELKEIDGYIVHALLPNLTKDHRRIYFTRFNENESHSQRKLFLYYINAVMINEYIKSHDYSDGIIAINDLRGTHITDLLAHINLTELQQFATIGMEGYDARIKSLHFISTSKAIDLLIKVFKQVLSTKIANRIHVHKTHEELYEFVSQELLPKEYGGEEKSLNELNEKCLEVFSSEENIQYWKAMHNAKTDESRRLGNSAFNENLGVAGTFRTLSVD